MAGIQEREETIADGWERIRLSFSIQFEKLADGRHLILDVDVKAGQKVRQYWMADHVLPCAACGSYVVLDRDVYIMGDQVMLTCDSDHSWTVVADEYGQGEPPARGRPFS